MFAVLYLDFNATARKTMQYKIQHNEHRYCDLDNENKGTLNNH